MASVQLRSARLDDLPSVCVVTGEPTDQRSVWDFAWVPRRRWLAVLLWSLPTVALAGAVDPVRLRVALPVSARGERLLLWRRMRGPLGALLAVLVLVVAWAVEDPVVAGASGGLALASLVVWLADGRRSPWMVTGDEPGTVRLGGVSPAFVTALAQGSTADGG